MAAYTAALQMWWKIAEFLFKIQKLIQSIYTVSTHVSCWYFGISTCSDCYPISNVKSLHLWVEKKPFTKKTPQKNPNQQNTDLSLPYAKPGKILLFESAYCSALCCWIPKTASIKLTRKSALSLVFPLEETWPKSKNWKEKHGLSLAACAAEELWAPDQIWVKKLPLLAGTNSRLSVHGRDGL